MFQIKPQNKIVLCFLPFHEEQYFTLNVSAIGTRQSQMPVLFLLRHACCQLPVQYTARLIVRLRCVAYSCIVLMRNPAPDGTNFSLSLYGRWYECLDNMNKWTLFHVLSGAFQSCEWRLWGAAGVRASAWPVRPTLHKNCWNLQEHCFSEALHRYTLQISPNDLYRMRSSITPTTQNLLLLLLDINLCDKYCKQFIRCEYTNSTPRNSSLAFAFALAERCHKQQQRCGFLLASGETCPNL